MEYRIDLLSHDHVFRKGHRIMIQVQSTWFPVIDRNPQKFVPNIFSEADEKHFWVATQRNIASKAEASAIVSPRGARLRSDTVTKLRTSSETLPALGTKTQGLGLDGWPTRKLIIDSDEFWRMFDATAALRDCGRRTPRLSRRVI